MGACGSKKIVIDAAEVMSEANKHAKDHGATSLHFTKLQVSHMADLFNKLNDGEKSCTREQFKNIFNFDDESLDVLYDAFDTDHSGTLELAEMISGLSFLCRGSVEEKLRFLFTVYDADGSGFLEHSELLPMFQKLTDQLVSLETASKRRNNEIGKANESDEAVLKSQSKVKELADEFKAISDLDGDGKISYEEFENYMENNELCRKFLQIMSETGNTLREENTNFS
mmetsp:Transcript_19835/g.41404  ORF Transcript_19835/g.41404 Transcript_19835/m.41404 type:complete len:227 (-) Transcript_19835:117-797(-)|eukprot:CAMPEP_0118645092 /NCGR_PEP_ID=MMETSP0785-20121206/7308_1 /TAXON_ID=91992 /ORGANISM="Bolidomonas pacifica, Strain CCMP 1866" /LENGTH=226 /DNA_ID=CAMNT_0006536935 /DNA_START=92 /DNA_END=772 /DNA_ORIENTATION=-